MVRAHPGGASAASRNGLRAVIISLCVVAIGLFIFAAPALIVFTVGMVPTAVAIFIDRDPNRYASVSVSAMNFAGVSFYLTEFIFGSASLSRALALVSDVFVLAVIYGAAAAGWLLILALPPMSAIVLKVMSDSKIQALRKDQNQLIEEWGKEVAEP